MQKILFICSANVGRSQIAEGYYNNLTNSKNGSSAALIEDKREKYHYSPAGEIVDVMLQDGIDVSDQSIKLLNKEMCENVGRIILFLDPSNKKSEFQIEGKDAISFLMDNYADKINIFSISDPFGEGVNKTISIRNQIKEFIKSIGK